MDTAPPVGLAVPRLKRRPRQVRTQERSRSPSVTVPSLARADAEAGVTVPFGSAVNRSLVAGPVR